MQTFGNAERLVQGFAAEIRACGPFGERQNREFSNAIQAVHETLEKLKAGKGSMDEQERLFLIERVQALQDFFDAIDHLTIAVSKLDNLGISTVRKVLTILK